MANSVFSMMRGATLGFWMVVVMAILGMFPAPWDGWVIITGAVIALAHVVEIFVFRNFVASYESKSKAIVNIMLYGVFWILPTKQNK